MTPELVKERLRDAAQVLKRMQLTVGPQGYRSNWPDVVQRAWDAGWYIAMIANDGTRVWKRDKPTLTPAKPCGREIDDMDEALSWMQYVQGETTRMVVWSRAEGIRWSLIAQQTGKSRAWLHVLERSGLNAICNALNARKVA